MGSIPLALNPIGLSAESDDRLITCPRCSASLVLHQPDEQWPQRLLGTCADCHAWFLIDAAREIMIQLPDEEELRGCSGSAGQHRSNRRVAVTPALISRCCGVRVGRSEGPSVSGQNPRINVMGATSTLAKGHVAPE
jgi:hypothetical protein